MNWLSFSALALTDSSWPKSGNPIPARQRVVSTVSALRSCTHDCWKASDALSTDEGDDNAEVMFQCWFRIGSIEADTSTHRNIYAL